MKVSFFIVSIALVGFIHAGEMVEVTATLVPVSHTQVKQLSQIEMRQAVSVARSQGAADLLKLGSVVESGQWATIRRGREFHHPKVFSDATVCRSPGDEASYSISNSQLSAKSDTVILPNSPTELAETLLGAEFMVRPTIKSGGLISIKGHFRDTVFEGLTEESVDISMTTKQLVKGEREHSILSSRIDQPVFRKVHKSFEVVLPYGTGSSEKSRLLRESTRKYRYYLPVEIGNTVFGAPGKIDLNSNQRSSGLIRNALAKATSVKNLLRKNSKEGVQPRAQGIVEIEVKKVRLPKAKSKIEPSKPIYIAAKLVELPNMPRLENSVLSSDEYTDLVSRLAKQKNVEVLSTPILKLKPGFEGRTQVVKQVPFAAQFAPPTIDRSTGAVVETEPSQSTRRHVGISMAITATVAKDNQIRLKLNAEIREFEGFLDFGNPIMSVQTKALKKVKVTEVSPNVANLPVFPIRSFQTEVVIPNGKTMATTLLYDFQNENKRKGRVLVVGPKRVEEIRTPRYLAIFLTASSDG